MSQTGDDPSRDADGRSAGTFRRAEGGRHASRRRVLAATGGLLTAGVAGCLGRGSESVRLLSAGSLARTFEEYVGPAFESETGITIHGEYYGSNAVMRMVEDRTKLPDVIVSADATLLRDRLYEEFTDWDIEFATNSVGIAYNPDTRIGQQLDDGHPWYRVFAEGNDGDVAISDPDLDPLGYRAVQAFILAERSYGLDGFRDDMLQRVYMEPEEPQLLAGVDAGGRAAAVAYRNMAVDHGLPFVEFPDEYNFADPSMEEHYASVEYTTDDGYTVEGRPVLYNATVHDDADAPDAGRRLVEFLADEPSPLVDAGLAVDEALPRARGTLPEALSV